MISTCAFTPSIWSSIFTSLLLIALAFYMSKLELRDDRIIHRCRNNIQALIRETDLLLVGQGHG